MWFVWVGRGRGGRQVSLDLFWFVSLVVELYVVVWVCCDEVVRLGDGLPVKG